MAESYTQLATGAPYSTTPNQSTGTLGVYTPTPGMPPVQTSKLAKTSVVFPAQTLMNEKTTGQLTQSQNNTVLSQQNADAKAKTDEQAKKDALVQADKQAKLAAQQAKDAQTQGLASALTATTQPVLDKLPIGSNSLGTDASGNQKYADLKGNIYIRTETGLGTDKYSVGYQMVSSPKDELLDRETTETTKPMTEEEAANQKYEDSKAKYIEDSDKARADLDQFQNGTYPLTPDQQSLLDATKAQFEGLIKQQQLTNQSYENGVRILGNVTGRAQYFPDIAMQEVKNAINSGLQKVADLNSKEASALATMRQGFQDDNFKLVAQAHKMILDIDAEIEKQMKDTHDAIIKEQEKAQARQDKIDNDLYERVTKPIQELMKDVAKNGAPQDIQDLISGATTVEDAIANAGDWIQSATGDLGDYLQYKRELEKQGLTPMNFQQYKDDKDAKELRKKSAEAYASAYASAKGKGAGEAEAESIAMQKAGIAIPDEYKTVLNTILGSGKFTKDQTKAITNAVMSGEDPFTVVKNQAKGIMTNTEANKVGNFEDAKSAMVDLQSALNEYYAKGGKTNIFTGSLEKTMNKLGEVKNPELVDLATRISASLQVYRNAISGTAYSEQEGKDIASIFPGINKTQGLNTAIIDSRMKAFDSTIDGAYRTVLGGTYDKIKTLEDSKVSDFTAKNDVDNYIQFHPEEAQNIASMYKVAGATDQDIYSWLKTNGKIK